MKYHPEDINQSIYNVIVEFLDDLTIRKRAYSTVHSYKAVLLAFFSWCKKNLKEVVITDIRDWQSEMVKAGKSKRTVDGGPRIVLFFLKFCESRGYIDTYSFEYPN